MFHTSLLTKNLLFCLVVFSFSWGFSEVFSTSSLWAQQTVASAEIIEKKHRTKWGWLSSWTDVSNQEKDTVVDFKQDSNGKAKLATLCKARMTVQPNNPLYEFRIRVTVLDENDVQIHSAMTGPFDNWGGTITEAGPTVTKDNYTGDKMTVKYVVERKLWGAGTWVNAAEWEVTFVKKLEPDPLPGL